jgi:hypothetical protein
MQNTYKPGEKATRSGQYEIVDSNGARTGEERTVVKNEPFPPTPEQGQQYVLIDPSENNAGKA